MTEDSPELQVTKFQKSEQITLKRSEIKNAPYNPRKISEDALTQIRKNFRRVGLLGGIVVNKRTMNIVSGHQRLKALDQLEKKADYLIRVEMIDVDEKTEIEQNIFMNSHSVQGEFDMDLLKVVLPDIDYSNAGFTEVDMTLIGIGFENSEDVITMTDQMDDMDNYNSKKQSVKDMKKQIQQGIEDKFEEGDPLLVLSFESFEAKARFMQRFDMDPLTKFINGPAFGAMIERIE